MKLEQYKTRYNSSGMTWHWNKKFAISENKTK